MKNISMLIRGAIGIKKGLGRDEIFFDLKDKTGLVALAGPNGKGKTTFLELMSLYRTLASRKGSLKHHFFLRNSRVEHKFIYDGDEYHLIWKIDSGSDKSEAFIIVNGESVVNGKNTEYDKYIIEKFGSQILFYNSVFCAQGSGNLSTMTTGKIKELFVEFLRIERLAEYEKQCKIAVSYCQKKIDVLSGKIETCDFELMGLQNIDEEIKGSNIIISNTELSLDDKNKEINSFDITINDLNSKAKKQITDIVRKEELETELKKLNRDRDQHQIKINFDSGVFLDKKALLDKEMVSIDTILANKEKILKAATRINNLERWEQYFSDCFECSIEEQTRFNREIKDVENKKQGLVEKLTDLENDIVLDGLKTTLQYLENRRVHFDTEDTIFKNKLKSAENDFSLMQASQNVKACQEKIAISIDPDCKSLMCPASDMVSEAREALPGLEKIESDIKAKLDSSIKVIGTAITLCNANLVDIAHRIDRCSKDYKNRYDAIMMKSSGLNKKVSELDTAKNELYSKYLIVDEFKGFYKSKRNEKRQLISDLKDLSSQKPQIEIAEEKKISIEKQTKQLVDDNTTRMADHATNALSNAGDIKTKKESISKIDDDIDSDIADKINEAETNKADSVTKKAGIVKTLDELKESAAVLKNNLSRKKDISIDLELRKSEEKAIKKELSEWEYLRLACSKTGLQALEIDGAAPLITSEANTLLEKAFGLDSQIKIITQDPETGKEVFWIKVIREDGSEDDFSNLSGGQKVWISKALSLGMTLVSKRKSGRNFMTLYADEEDGALDGEKALEFIKLYRSMMLTGDFETCFFISHNPEVVGMADHVIDFGAL